MRLSRRSALVALAFVGSASVPRASGAQEQWFAISSDDGKPVPNTRLPVELTSEVEELRGLYAIGAREPETTIVEFFDYNCPYCRAAAKDIHDLAHDTPGLRVGLVNNPVLSPRSAEAAKLELALLRSRGPEVAYSFHRAMFERRGTVGRSEALDTAEGVAAGLPRARLEELADSRDVAEILATQKALAASLGFAATPSFLIGTAGVSGYPGSHTLRRMIAAFRACDQIEC